jgi:hypothetical protein
MLQQAGHIKPKNSLLGFFLGPLHTDHIWTQVVYGCEVTLARGRLEADSEAIWLSGWSGPAFTDLNYTRDVGFTTFSPLEGDNDFGAGPAYFYHLDTAPMVFLVHPNKGQRAMAKDHFQTNITCPFGARPAAAQRVPHEEPEALVHHVPEHSCLLAHLAMVCCL